MTLQLFLQQKVRRLHFLIFNFLARNTFIRVMSEVVLTANRLRKSQNKQ